MSLHAALVDKKLSYSNSVIKQGDLADWRTARVRSVGSDRCSVLYVYVYVDCKRGAGNA